MKRICVIDGQGGGIGSVIIQKLRERLEDRVEILALGTNAIAATQMLKAKANRGASGENAIVQTSKHVDMIICPISLLLPHTMMGEVTPAMAEALAVTNAFKIVLPLWNEGFEMVGLTAAPLPHLADDAVNICEKKLNELEQR